MSGSTTIQAIAVAPTSLAAAIFPNGVAANIAASSVIPSDTMVSVTVPAAFGARVQKSGDTMTGPLTLAADPSTAMQAATKQYTDAQVALPRDMSISTAIATGSTASRSLSLRFADMNSVKNFGAVGDGATDDTAAFQALMNAGGGYIPELSGGNFYKVTSTINVTVSGSKVYGSGRASLIKLVLTPGTASIPVIDVKPSAVGTFLANFGVDGGGALLAQNTVYGGNLIAPSGILVQANQSYITGMFVTNTFANGISIVQLSGSVVVSNLPNNVIVANCYTLTCGIGVSTAVLKPGKNGCGIDMASCSLSVVTNCVDHQSYTGFTIDIGAGALCTMSNCMAGYTQIDTANIGKGSGTGFYIASPNCQVSNCQTASSAGVGFWLDGTGFISQLSNCYVRYAGAVGFWIKGSQWQLSNCVAYNCGQSTTPGIAGVTNIYGAAPFYDAFLVDSSPGAIYSVSLANCAAYGTSHRYGYAEYPGAWSVSALLLDGSNFTGSVAGVKPGTGTAGIFFSGSLFGTTTLNLGTKFGQQLQVGDAGAQSVNFSAIKGSLTGSPVQWVAAGTDANIDMQISPKGASGVVNITATSSATATIGTAGAPPAQVAAYLPIKISGVSYKIPVYLP